MSKPTTKGIFCLEGDWDGDLRSKRSIQPILDLLGKSNDPTVLSIRRDIGTIPELEHYLKKWTQQRYRQYPVLYLAFHGDPGVLYVGDHHKYVDLDWIEERLAGHCQGRVIHFGSCGTMATHGRRLQTFMKRTGVLAVCGYKVTVDWMLSTAFEIILLSAFQNNALTRSGVRAVHNRIKKEAAGLTRELSFRLEIRK